MKKKGKGNKNVYIYWFRDLGFQGFQGRFTARVGYKDRWWCEKLADLQLHPAGWSILLF